jgi:hypothetical protein
VQIVQQLKPDEEPRRQEFAIEMLDHINTSPQFLYIDTSPQFLGNILFSDKATFHLSGFVNRQNARIWGTQNP